MKYPKYKACFKMSDHIEERDFDEFQEAKKAIQDLIAHGFRGVWIKMYPELMTPSEYQNLSFFPNELDRLLELGWAEGVRYVPHRQLPQSYHEVILKAAIDMFEPVSSHAVEEYKISLPAEYVLDGDVYRVIKGVMFKEVTEERFMDMLGVLPPEYQDGCTFLMGEAMSHRRCSVTKRIAPTYLGFTWRKDQYYETVTDLTFPEFKQALKEFREN